MLAAMVFAMHPCVTLAQAVKIAERLETCKSCHGADGNSVMENTPSLAGQPEDFIINQLVLMREGVRPVASMTEFVKDLTDADIPVIAAYFSKLPAKLTGPIVDKDLIAKGKLLAEKLVCISCHGKTLGGNEQIPRLAKQRVDYLLYALRAFRDDKRPGADTVMTAAIPNTSDADLQALAHYAASR